MKFKELQTLNNYQTDKFTGHSYHETYDKLFTPYQNLKFKLVEVGYYTGGSLRLWEDYFTKAQILGIDITDEHRISRGEPFKTDRVSTLVRDIRTMKSKDFEGYEIAIDDGSHHLQDQIKFLEIMLPSVKGLVIVEDVLPHYVESLKKLGNCEVIDLRGVKNRHDDILMIYRT
jgi:hypothetical protein